MFNDTISDVLTRIRNAGMVDSSTVRIPLTRMSQQLCHILEKEGFITSFHRDEATKEGPSFLTLHLTQHNLILDLLWPKLLSFLSALIFDNISLFSLKLNSNAL